MVVELTHDQARKTCANLFQKCKSTEELLPLSGIIGQNRAVKALEFGLKIQDKGFNIYIAGMPGTGRKTLILNYLEAIAKERPVSPEAPAEAPGVSREDQR